MAGHRTLSPTPMLYRSIPMLGNRLRSGWSLLEGLLVLAILATMTALAVPVLENNEQATPAVRRFLADAVRARSLAQSSWQETEMKLNPSAGAWRVEGRDGTVHPGPLADASGWTSLGKGVSFVPSGKTPSVFRFQANGRATAKAAICIRAGKATWQITLDELTSTLTAGPVGKSK